MMDEGVKYGRFALNRYSASTTQVITHKFKSGDSMLVFVKRDMYILSDFPLKTGLRINIYPAISTNKSVYVGN
jgi:hypothetical protein